MDYASSATKDVLNTLDATEDGLSASQVSHRLKQYGPNRLKLKPKHSLLSKLLEPFRNWFIIILILAAVISLVLGKKVDATVICIIVAANSLIYYIQRFSADHALKALSRKDVRKIKVLRGGKVIAVVVDELVPGDIMVLQEGNKVPADGRIITSERLQVNESMLTGESLPVAKNAEPIKPGKLIFEQIDMVFQGTIVTAGLAHVVVTATGMQTELAKIAQLSQDDMEESPLQRKIGRLTSRIIYIVLGIAAFTFVLGLYRGLSVSDMLSYVLSLTVSAVPESLPIALTVILVFGVKRMAKKKTLVRNLSAVETLGQATIIATDKTGTITKNKLSVASIWHPDGQTKALEQAARLAAASEDGHSDDPLEKIIEESFRLEAPKGWKRVKLLPFEQEQRFSGAIWKSAGEYKLFIKGAPEVILEKVKLSPAAKRDAQRTIHQLSSQGFRLIGFASGSSHVQPDSKHLPLGLKLDGILAFADQLRPEIPGSIATTKEAGIKVIMLTGDHLDTARSFGLQSGIIQQHNQAEAGSTLSSLSPSAIRDLLKEVHVIARVLPEHKFKILEALDDKEVTVMTGDGVNDVPAIVKADVGIAMGNGSDAAKEASDVILLDNNYATIVEAVREGRTILANVRKMVFYLFATNMGEIMTMVGALIIGLPLPLTALQVLWINLVTDGFTVVPLGLEPPEDSHMQTPPESSQASLLPKQMLRRVIATAAFMATLTLIVFWLYLPKGLVVAQTMAFAVLVVVQWANALNARSASASFVEGFKRPNYALWGAIVLSGALQALVLFGVIKIPLGLVSVGWREIGIMLGAVALVLIYGDVLKHLLPVKPSQTVKSLALDQAKS